MGRRSRFRGRDGKSLNRYFPEVVATLLEQMPQRCVLDGEIVIAAGGKLDFDALQLRVHPAASRGEAAGGADSGFGGVLRCALRGGGGPAGGFRWKSGRGRLDEVLAGDVAAGGIGRLGRGTGRWLRTGFGGSKGRGWSHIIGYSTAVAYSLYPVSALKKDDAADAAWLQNNRSHSFRRYARIYLL